MALPKIKGLDFLYNINWRGFLDGAGGFFLVLAIFLIVALLIGVFLWKRKQVQLYNKRLFFFEEVNGNMTPVEDHMACEMTIPNTNIKVFYIKKLDLYLPRPTKRMGKDAYWFCIRNNREVVNFAMKNLNDEMKESNLDYDHTDMRYALANLSELIKRNYRDKATVWWKEYKDVISTVIFIFVMSIAFFLLLSQIGKLLDRCSSLISVAEQLIKTAEATRGSGVAVTTG